MSKIVKVLDKGFKGDPKNKIPAAPRQVLERFSVDANEIVASDPDRFEIVGDETPHDEDIQGNPTKVAARPRKFVKNPEAGESGVIPPKDETE